MGKAPFRVYKTDTGWHLLRRCDGHIFRWFPTAAGASDFARKNWPWWP